jgi:hypothetical protein
VSIFDAYRTQTATITAPGTVNVDKPWEGAAGSVTTSPCRFERMQKRVVKADGSYDLSAGVIWFPAGVVLPDGCRIAIDTEAGASFTPMVVDVILDVPGNVGEIEVPVQ